MKETNQNQRFQELTPEEMKMTPGGGLLSAVIGGVIAGFIIEFPDFVEGLKDGWNDAGGGG